MPDYSIFALLPVIIIGILIFLALNQKRSSSAQFRRKALMTGNEREFFRRLTDALGHRFHIFPQVSMGAVIEPVAFDKKKRLADFRRISQKRIDFLICDRDMSVVAVIELDDRTHNAGNDNRRDGFLASAGIKSNRYRSKQKPYVQEIQSAIDSLRRAA
mgnify:FL=1